MWFLLGSIREGVNREPELGVQTVPDTTPETGLHRAEERQ